RTDARSGRDRGRAWPGREPPRAGRRRGHASLPRHGRAEPRPGRLRRPGSAHDVLSRDAPALAPPGRGPRGGGRGGAGGGGDRAPGHPAGAGPAAHQRHAHFDGRAPDPVRGREPGHLGKPALLDSRVFRRAPRRHRGHPHPHPGVLDPGSDGRERGAFMVHPGADRLWEGPARLRGKPRGGKSDGGARVPDDPVRLRRRGRARRDRRLAGPAWRPGGRLGGAGVRRAAVRECSGAPARPVWRRRGPAAWSLASLGAGIVAVLPAFLGGTGLTGSLAITGILFIGVLGLDLLMGYTGQVSLGHAGFMAVGGYTAAILATRLGVAPLAATGAGIALSLAVALVLALVTARLRGLYLALATLAFGLLVDSVTVGLTGL